MLRFVVEWRVLGATGTIFQLATFSPGLLQVGEGQARPDGSVRGRSAAARGALLRAAAGRGPRPAGGRAEPARRQHGRDRVLPGRARVAALSRRPRAGHACHGGAGLRRAQDARAARVHRLLHAQEHVRRPGNLRHRVRPGQSGPYFCNLLRHQSTCTIIFFRLASSAPATSTRGSTSFSTGSSTRS